MHNYPFTLRGNFGLEAADLTHARQAIIELDALSRFERPLPVLTDYDGLLDQEVAP
jgi:hypothetical protein